MEVSQNRKLKSFSLAAIIIASFSFSISAQSTESATLAPVLGKIGIGLGVSYGVIGAGAEIGTQYIAVVGGVGTLAVISGGGWGIGGRAYFLNSTHKWRPHLTIIYGTTALYSISGAVEAEGALKGMGIYLGVDQDVGKIGGFSFTYGLGFITHEDIPQDVTNRVSAAGGSLPSFGAPIKIMVGCNYRFGG